MCKAWCRIAKDASLWRRPRFSHCEKLDRRTLERVLSWCGLVREVDVHYCPLVDDGCLDSIAEKCPDLQVLNVEGCFRLTSAGLLAVGTRCQQIETLILSVPRHDSVETLVHLIENLNNLKRLEVLSKEREEDELHSLTIGFHLLHALQANSSLQSFTCENGTMTDELVIPSSWNFNLRELHLPYCNQLDSAVLKCIADTCPSLQSLDVSHCRNVYDSGIGGVSNSCNQLKHLNVSACDGVTDIGIVQVAENCPLLQTVCVAGNVLHKPPSGNITDVAVSCIAQNCPDLCRLNVKWCQGVSDAGIAEVASHCTNLTHINTGGCLSISDVSMKVLATFSKNLRCLEIVECLRITTAGVNDIVQNCRKLEHVDMQVCSYVTDLRFDGAGSMVSYIDLSYCTKITDAGLSQISSHCPKLRYLSVAGCHRITDAGLKVVCRSCSCLEYLDASFRGMQTNFNITNGTLTELALHCPFIQHLDLVGCWNITQDCLELVVKSCRYLKQLNFSQFTADSDLHEGIASSFLKLRSSCSCEQLLSPAKEGKRVQSFLFKLATSFLWTMSRFSLRPGHRWNSPAEFGCLTVSQTHYISLRCSCLGWGAR